jgi:uncharacterized protein (TIGR02246 family)
MCGDRLVSMMDSYQVDEAAIRTLVDEMTDAYVNHDLDRFLTCFSKDIVALPPGMGPVVGIEAWRKVLTGFFESGTPSEVEENVEEVAVAGDWAFDRHSEAATYTSSETGESERLSFKGIHVFRREDDGWKIARYVWNLTEPSE